MNSSDTALPVIVRRRPGGYWWGLWWKGAVHVCTGQLMFEPLQEPVDWSIPVGVDVQQLNLHPETRYLELCRTAQGPPTRSIEQDIRKFWFSPSDRSELVFLEEGLFYGLTGKEFVDPVTPYVEPSVPTRNRSTIILSASISARSGCEQKTR